MKSDQFGQIIYNEDDLINAVMSNTVLGTVLVEPSIKIDHVVQTAFPQIKQYTPEDITVEHFDQQCQTHWYMPGEYQQLDIAAHVLDLCNSSEELQRCGQELLMYQERGMFPVLCYVKYLVDTMKQHSIIWGVGRGSSVASYVLYKLGLHRIDSLYYDLDPADFLR
jgi:DNA polymerase III alpha subunit